MTDLTPFTNGEFKLDITPHEVDGFRVVAAQVAKALSVDSARNLLRSIPSNEQGVSLVTTLGGEQRASYLTEAGFYRALGMRQTGRIEDPAVRSQVERFQAWVYGVVLPGMRTGKIISAKTQVELVTKADLARMVLESEEEKAVLSAALESAAPAIAYHDRFVSEDDVITVKVWGAQFGLTEPQAYALLRDKNIVYRISLGERWSTKQGRKIEVFEYRPRAGRVTFAWFDLRPQHNVSRHHNGQVRQTLYVRQSFSLQLGAKCGVSTTMHLDSGDAA